MPAYVVLSESRHDGWTAARITYADAQRLLKDEDIVVYIFRCDQPLAEMHLYFPFSEYYECLSINKYDQTAQFDSDDEYVTIAGPAMTVTHST